MRLTQRYLLAVPIPFARDADGRIWLDKLWWHDLRVHLDYIQHIVVLAPFLDIEKPEPEMIEAVPPEGSRLEFVGLFPQAGLKEMLLDLPRSIRTTWGTIGQCDLVHSGVAGWPVPIGVIVNPIAVWRKKPLILVVESAFWRLQKGYPSNWKMRLRAWLNEHFAKWSLRHADLAIYTHDGYRTSLPIGPKGTATVLPASWISEGDIISREEAMASWETKALRPRFLLASRLESQKGIPLFLEMLRQLEKRAEPIEIDVIGSGAMKPDIEAFAKDARAVRVRLLAPVPYGNAFMRLLREYHAVIVPLTGDEQARILYDSFSQAVPVVATDTAGNRGVVKDGHTGLLVRPDPQSFANTLASCAQNPQHLREMGIAALDTAAEYTHASMHGKRAELLTRLFGSTRAMIRQ